jgi:hypothetical protein
VKKRFRIITDKDVAVQPDRFGECECDCDCAGIGPDHRRITNGDELVAANSEKISMGISARRGEAEAASCRPEAQSCAQNGDAITPGE